MLNEPIVAGLRQRLLLLRRVNSFGRLSEHAALLMAEHAQVGVYAEGELALEEGRLDEVHIVASGRFDITRRGRPVSTVREGGVLGVMSMLARDTYGVTARALEPARTLRVPIDIMTDICEGSYTFLRAAMRIGSGDYMQVRGHVLAADGVSQVQAPGADIGLVERAIELSERSLFRDWNANAIFDVARTATCVELAAGQVLWPTADRATAAFHVASGLLACNESCRIESIGPGAMPGLLEMLSEQAPAHTVSARTRCVLLRIDLDDLLAALDTHRDLALDLLAKISRGLLPNEPDGSQ